MGIVAGTLGVAGYRDAINRVRHLVRSAPRTSPSLCLSANEPAVPLRERTAPHRTHRPACRRWPPRAKSRTRSSLGNPTPQSWATSRNARRAPARVKPRALRAALEQALRCAAQRSEGLALRLPSPPHTSARPCAGRCLRRFSSSSRAQRRRSSTRKTTSCGTRPVLSPLHRPRPGPHHPPAPPPRRAGNTDPCAPPLTLSRNPPPTPLRPQ